MTDRVECSVKDFFCDDIFGKRVFDNPNLDSWHPARSVFIGAVDFLIFPLIMTGVSFVFSCFVWFFDKLTEHLGGMPANNCCAMILMLLLFYVSVTVTLVLYIPVAACLLLRAIASAVLFLIALPFFFAYDTYVHRPPSGRAPPNNNPVLNHNNSRPLATTAQHTTGQARSIYSPPAQQTNQGQNHGDYSASAPPSYDQVVAQTLHGTYSPNPC